MEKKEARIRCTGCGSQFKVKIPVTDKPVSFKCKKCGKVLKLRVKESEAAPESAAAPPPPPAPPKGKPAKPPSANSYDPHEFGAVDFGSGDLGSGPKSGASPADAGDASDFEMTQLPDTDSYQNTPGSGPMAEPEKEPVVAGALDSYAFDEVRAELGVEDEPPPPELEDSPGDGAPSAGAIPDAESPGSAMDRPAASMDDRSRWMVLAGDMVRGPFNDEEIRQMIESGEVAADTSLRMGERPWVKAAEIGAFRKLFPDAPQPVKRQAASVPTDMDEEEAVGRPFHKDPAAILPYPIEGGKPIPLAVFGGIAFVVFTVLCLDFLIGFTLSLIAWVILYGYLATLMELSAKSPAKPPPDWDFARFSELVTGGGKVFAVLFLYSLLPTGIMLLLMIMFFLNGMTALGYVFLLLTLVVYAGSLFTAPAALALLMGKDGLGAALNPGNAIKVIKEGGTPYMTLAKVSLGLGMAFMAITVLSVFLVDIPIAGFILAGLLMAAGFSYGHFVWFHAVGRFSGENKQVTGAAAA